MTHDLVLPTAWYFFTLTGMNSAKHLREGHPQTQVSYDASAKKYPKNSLKGLRPLRNPLLRSLQGWFYRWSCLYNLSKHRMSMPLAGRESLLPW